MPLAVLLIVQNPVLSLLLDWTPARWKMNLVHDCVISVEVPKIPTVIWLKKKKKKNEGKE